MDCSCSAVNSFPVPQDLFNDYNVFEKRLSYMLVISDFLNVYENNRKKYKNFEAFYPELEKHILNIITEEKDINFKNDF